MFCFDLNANSVSVNHSVVNEEDSSKNHQNVFLISTSVVILKPWPLYYRFKLAEIKEKYF